MPSTSARGTMVIALLLSAMAAPAHALSGVDPNGVNVNATGPTTVFITFQGTGADERPAGAFWCGEITVPANTVTSFNPCVPGTLFGNLPGRNSFVRPSGTGGAANFTDLMTIPASVARRAYQDAVRGEVSSFFYVRRFVNTVTGAEQYVAVTCRMSGGGARTPLALMNVIIDFNVPRGDRPVFVIAPGQEAPPLSARIQYNGTGRLKGRWEVVLPGDPPPTVEDLLPEPSLPVELRGMQRRYTELQRFDVFLPPTGEVVIPGPLPARVPTSIEGPHLVLLRIETTADKEGDSNTTAGVVGSGGVAGFPLPVLRYWVGEPDRYAGEIGSGELQLLDPDADAQLTAGAPLSFTWQDLPGAALYFVEVEAEGVQVLKAVVAPGASRYDAPPWLRDHAGKPMRWRVVAADARGIPLRPSEWRQLRISN